MKTEAQHDQACFSMQCELFGGQESIADADGCSLKTSQDFTPATMEKTLLPWLEKWLGPALVYRETDGAQPELLLGLTDSASGCAWTRNGSEWHNDADVVSLSEILETGNLDPRYFLSSTACTGILRRAAKRGKALPEQLMQALVAVAETE